MPEERRLEAHFALAVALGGCARRDAQTLESLFVNERSGLSTRTRRWIR
jgi:hypothetical protein